MDENTEALVRAVLGQDLKNRIIVGLFLMGYSIPECAIILGHTRGAIALRWRRMIVEVRQECHNDE